jgi:hypothetical protein
MRRFFAMVPFFVLAAGLLGQEGPAPTQAPNPYPPGTHGGGQYPSLPGKKSKSKPEEDLTKFSGELHEMATDHIVIETADHRTVSFHLTKDTKFLDGDTVVTLKEVSLGQLLDVEAQENDEEEFFAVRVHLKAQPTTVVKDDKADPDEEDRPKLKFGKPTAGEARGAPDSDDDERPVVKAGKPAAAATPTEVAEADASPDGDRETNVPSPTSPTVSKAQEHAEFLEKAREMAFTFTDGLPNYMCQEMVTRYFSENHAGTLWKPMDVVSEDVVWNNNHEIYRNVTVDGKKVNPDKMANRAWSSGEFGSVLAQLLYPGTDAHFAYVRAATLHHFNTAMYDFTVDLAHSHWLVSEGGQSIQPAYSGTIWFDKTTGQVLRLEYGAEDIPKEFPADTVERTIDYDYVQLGQKKFLLPVHSEVMGCHRGTSECMKNSIDFRNYHKYGAESDIKFGTEENAPPLAPAPPAKH